MLDHVGISVHDVARSRAFYLAALAPLGYGILMEASPPGGHHYIGFGVIGSGKPDFWIGDAPVATGHLHLAFAATDRAAVDAFYAAAIAAGARDNGAPGLRPHYHPNYYGAFVFDPDGLNVEAVCHLPETA
ncbi:MULTISPECIES: VOC family protein [Xanthobacter]|uniref:Catechol 2,3-dioxygenase-like lactoylglutathione lyase family enzyme n=1 Tax=Xanthobacter flavus TaxID=281 RepID=A0A9W6FIS4_XANFL|nr:MULTISPECIES: VOC family protein [Xanthobacter]MDR6333205.1 catechol 2,3-dioxygenase-like lactoylglutathione lyase family enzyme [Xanthobacter flavus]UDQ91108.1 VOC family protein [Xanthobacter autotrophicus]UJX46939.1 VOC family protein [Xanthobacter sp. YC-JY1]GLI21481.1 glyoxalase [Xanthobacter flavus]